MVDAAVKVSSRTYGKTVLFQSAWRSGVKVIPFRKAGRFEFAEGSARSVAMLTVRDPDAVSWMKRRERGRVKGDKPVARMAQTAVLAPIGTGTRGARRAC